MVPTSTGKPANMGEYFPVREFLNVPVKVEEFYPNTGNAGEF